MALFEALEESYDLQRIRALPARMLSEEQQDMLVELMTPHLVTELGKTQCNHCGKLHPVASCGGWKLRRAQAWVIWEQYQNSQYVNPTTGFRMGTFASVPVGGGKTAISFIVPRITNGGGARSPGLILPGSLVNKTMKEFAELQLYLIPPRPIPQLVTFEELSQEYNLDLLNRYAFDQLTIDESDINRNFENAVPQRIDMFKEAFPGSSILCQTGTFSRKSIKGYSHVLRWTVGPDLNPTPNASAELKKWAGCFDLDVPVSKVTTPGRYLTLATPEEMALGGSENAIARRVYQRRLRTTPGVIIIDESDCDKPLSVEFLMAPEDPIIDAAFEVLQEWRTPDGWDFETALEYSAHESEVGCGVYSVWDPRPPADWMAARKDKAIFVRETIKATRKSNKPLHTPAAVMRAFAEEPVIKAWREIEPSFTPNPVSRWLSGSTVYKAAEWLKNAGPRALVWSSHVAVGKAIAQVASCRYYGSQGLSDDGDDIETVRGGQVVLSIKANRRGRNLQDRWSKALLVGHFKSAVDWEQALFGRLHRYGQPDPVEVTVMATSGAAFVCVDEAYRESKHVFERDGTKHKILSADISYKGITGYSIGKVRWLTPEELKQDKE